MKLNLEEQEETIEPVEKTDLIYGIDDRPPFKEALFAALQHLLAIFVAIITPPLIIAGASKQPVFWFRWHSLHLASRHSYSVAGLVR